ncbi:MAG: S1-like domain-containing RNA-binding protein [Methylococcales bacterium]|nr:S1-like domain-containing RNA-binding protein [Methylococcales bacterium]MDD5753315.1 S1-like domain-containing RNA-binding protein [Methylococcales bacterium]
MINIGKINTLKISKQNSSGIYLSDESGKQVLLVDKKPLKYELDDSVDVFVFVDGDEHLAATTQKPLAQVGDIAYLKVVSVNYYGAFLEWGLAKNLLVPFSEQHHELEVGESYFFKLFLDDKERFVATTKLNHFLADEVKPDEFTVGQKVNLLIADETDLGVKAIVNNAYWGLLYENEIFQTLQKGQRIDGYIKTIRDDLRLDLVLNEIGYGKVTTLTDTILKMLRDNGGELAVSDKSEPEKIYTLFGVSKKVFKQAIGALYKQKLIEIKQATIRLI